MPEVVLSSASPAALLDRIATFVADHPAAHRDDGDAPARVALAEWSARLGRPLPEALAPFWAFTNRLSLIVDGIELLRATTAFDEWSTCVEVASSERTGDVEARGPVQARAWCDGWIPFALVDGSSAYHAVDLVPADGGTVGQIIAFESGCARRAVIAPSLTDYLLRLTKAFEAEELEGDGGEFASVGSDDRFFERHGYVEPSRPAPVVRAPLPPSPSQEPVREVRRALVARDVDTARTKLVALASAWLGPAVVGAVNQHIFAKQIVELFGALDELAPLDPSLVALRDRIATAPIPEVAMPDGDFL